MDSIATQVYRAESVVLKVYLTSPEPLKNLQVIVKTQRYLREREREREVTCDAVPHKLDSFSLVGSEDPGQTGVHDHMYLHL